VSKHLAFRHKKTGEINITRHPGHYLAEDGWERVPVPKAPKPTAEEKRRAKVRAMDSVERYDELQAQITALQARLDKAGL
jgi:hypothetical protein